MSAALLVADSGPLIALARPAALLRASIDTGERSAIALRIELDATPLIDDRRARMVAESSGRPAIGMLGLLARAREQGLITALRPLFERLQGNFMPNELVATALSSLNHY